MTNFKLMITADGKHPPEKWADVAADEIIEISAEAPQALMKEATEFRKKLYTSLTGYIKEMMDHEKTCIAEGKHALHLHYETEDHAKKAVDEICDIAKGTNFEPHFNQPHVRDHLEAVCNRFFKSAKLVERQHFHSEKSRTARAGGKSKK
jgi:hypothetical protein